ncbi:MAG TPA: hypothetical protein VF773_15650 [Verrucomicrobiae bacterium]
MRGSRVPDDHFDRLGTDVGRKPSDDEAAEALYGLDPQFNLQHLPQETTSRALSCGPCGTMLICPRVQA